MADSGFWGKLFRWNRADEPASSHERRGEHSLLRAREYAAEQGWVFSEQQEQLLADTLAELRRFGFYPSFPIDIAYTAYRCKGGMPAFIKQPFRQLLKLRGPELEPLFNRVLLPDRDFVSDEDAYVDLLWEAVAAAETSELLSNVNSRMDFQHTGRGTLSYTFGQRRVTHKIRIDLDLGDKEAVREIAASVSPTNYDLIYDGENFYCWVPTRHTAAFLQLLQLQED
ncbi:hypothetical protein [Corynebacterium sp. A21]|uniref:hypothetical protein n=1 Tax=Corynebacterium sp. A21 TaxID=3457318 RepID=UPI003FD142CD